MGFGWSGTAARTSSAPRVMHRLHSLARVDYVWGGAVSFGLLVFWWLRVSYWVENHEVAFSDIADYQACARNIVDRGFFGVSDFWGSYWPPVTPSAYACSMILSSWLGCEALMVWQWGVASLLSLGACFLAREIRCTIGGMVGSLMGGSFFVCVALSKASVFWSLKPSTETIAECLAYCFIATAMNLLRRRSILMYAINGFVASLAMLNRPANLALVIGGGVVCTILFISGSDMRRHLAAWLMGLMLLWAPWTCRNFTRYGTIVPVTTQAPFSFLSDMGDFAVWDNGVLRHVTPSRLHDELESSCRDDLDAMRQASRYVMLWIYEDPIRYAKKVLARTYRSLTFHDVALTKLSRDDLFLDWRDNCMMDRGPCSIWCGLLCMLLLVVAHKFYWVWLLAVWGPIAFSCVVIALPRSVEPYVALIMWSPILFLVGLMRCTLERLSGAR